PSSNLTVRDAVFLYEIEVREGRPVRATRTSHDGSFQRGPAVLAALLGVGAGRFVVASAQDAPAGRNDLEGALAEQLLAPTRLAGAAQRLLSGAALVSVERVEVAEERMGAYLDATPSPARSLLETIMGGGSPRTLITNGQVAPRLLEDVLCDAAA